MNARAGNTTIWGNRILAKGWVLFHTFVSGPQSTNRGNYRRDVFETVGAAQAFETVLGETCAQHDWRIHGHTIMRNHYHLALETPGINLVEGMHWLQSTFATRFNRFRTARGHLFQGYSTLSLEAGFEREELREIKETRWRDELNEALGERGRSIEEITSNDSPVNWRIEVAADLRGRTDAPYRRIADALSRRHSVESPELRVESPIFRASVREIARAGAAHLLVLLSTLITQLSTELIRLNIEHAASLRMQVHRHRLQVSA